MDLAQKIQARLDGTIRPQSPSRRTPIYSWHNNTADVIEHNMQRDGHRTWGFVIYRTTYSSDHDWARFLIKVRAETEDYFQFYNGLDILESKAETIIDDASRFDGANSHAVREHFRQWVADNLPAEQATGAGLSPRYRFAIQIDAEALNSIINEPSSSEGKIPPDQKGWVKLIDAEWFPGRWSDDETDEPIEGIRQEDVGWMKEVWEDIIGNLYIRCNNLNFWPSYYKRPPFLPYF